MGKMNNSSYGWTRLLRREIRHTHGLDPEISTGKVRGRHKTCKKSANGKHELITRYEPPTVEVPVERPAYRTRLEIRTCKFCGKEFRRSTYNYFPQVDTAYYERIARVKNWNPKMGKDKGRHVE
jgi:hypothetical protein